MNVEFLEALEEMAKEEGLDREELYEAVKKGLAVAYQEEFGPVKDLRVEIDRTTGDITIIADGQPIEFDLAKLGRIATRRAEETIRREIIKRRRRTIYERYKARVGEILNGSVHRFEGRNVWLNLGQAEALLPAEERIPGEHYRLGQTLRAYLYKVEQKREDQEPRIYVSRAHPGFVRKLLELEVPEIEKGFIEVVAVAREPGVRTKVAVKALVPELDPVGTCVGSSGARVREVVKELGGEKVDIIRWSDDVRELIKNSLEPARVLDIRLDEEAKKAVVVVPDEELSLAIGKGGQNVRLTAKLTGWSLDVTSPGELQRQQQEQQEQEEEAQEAEAQAAPSSE